MGEELLVEDDVLGGEDLGLPGGEGSTRRDAWDGAQSRCTLTGYANKQLKNSPWHSDSNCTPMKISHKFKIHAVIVTKIGTKWGRDTALYRQTMNTPLTGEGDRKMTISLVPLSSLKMVMDKISFSFSSEEDWLTDAVELSWPIDFFTSKMARLWGTCVDPARYWKVQIDR